MLKARPKQRLKARPKLRHLSFWRGRVRNKALKTLTMKKVKLQVAPGAATTRRARARKRTRVAVTVAVAVAASTLNRARQRARARESVTRATARGRVGSLHSKSGTQCPIPSASIASPSEMSKRTWPPPGVMCWRSMAAS